MKKLLVFLVVAASLFVALARPVQAGVVVEDVLVRRKGADVNIRVTVHNDTARRVQKPAIVLFVRKDDGESWTRIKTWNDISMIQPRYKVSRDFFEENNKLLRDLAASGSFQVKAVVQAPGLSGAAEKVSTWNADANK